ncbi:MAG: hypothetical protein IJW75_04200 [Alphaproteobacteria bacterium]|nr:hypothetical protein [Alphaproteobacteria bacterium]
MDKHQRLFHREAFSNMGNTIADNYGTIIKKLESQFDMELPPELKNRDDTNAQIGQLARFIVDKVGLPVSEDSDSNTFRGMEFLARLAKKEERANSDEVINAAISKALKKTR